MTTRTLIEPTVAAVATEVPLPDFKFPTTLIADGLAGAETVSVWLSHDQGTTWQAYLVGGAQLTLTATAPNVRVEGPAFLGVTKSATVAATGVYQEIFAPTDNTFD